MLSEQTNSAAEGFPSDLLVELRPSAGRGLRERFEHALRAAIQRQRLPAGTVLPPTRLLAAQLGISRSVVVEAYRNLTADGYVETRRGGWTRVRPNARSEGPAQGSGPGDYGAESFYGWRRPASPPRTPLRLLGGLPDPALFPRREWLRHYRAALAELPYPALGYPDILGAAALREALAAYLGRVRGAATTPDRILVCAGFTQGLTLACRMLRRAGARRVAVEDPCHGWHRTAIAQTGLEPVPVPVDGDGLDPALLSDHHLDALLVAPAHSYPSGGTLDAARRRELIAWARRTGTLIIEDDYDAEFRYDRTPIGALQGLAPEQVIYIGSASKSLTPALRLGWVAAPPTMMDALAEEKHFDDMGSSLIEQLALARFIDNGGFARHLRRARPIYRDRRDAAIAALAELLPGAHWHGAAAGLHLHVRLPGHVDEQAVARHAYDRGVLLEAGAWHWAAPERAPASIVLGYGSAGQRAIRRGIAVVADAIAAA